MFRALLASIALAKADFLGLNGADGKGFSGLVPGRFQGKVCFITGATSGLGEMTAYHLAQEGCAVAITGRREDKGKQVEANIAKLSASNLVSKALFIKNDITDYDSMKDVVEKINVTWGRLDAVFANAGVSGTEFGTSDQISMKEFKFVMDVNVNGVFSTVHHAVPLMKRTSDAKKTMGGTIVLCSSIFGERAEPGMPPYITSKHALEGMKKTMAAGLMPFGIRVNNINPTFTPSEMTQGIDAMPAVKELIVGNLPSKRMATPGEIAGPTAFLLSDHSSYISGQSIVVDNGLINSFVSSDNWFEGFSKGFEELTAMMAAAEKNKKEL
jgi:NAD(P)-dependent dehydrogenase (short-subunit alcohol dehydrogenase family)